MKDISVRFGITQCIKKQRHHLVDIGLSSQSYGFSNSHVWMWKLDHKEGWALKNRCFWTVVLEKILENCLDCKKIKPVNPKGNQPWIFIGRTVVEAEAPILWPLDSKNQFIGKDPGAGNDWGQEEKGVTEYEMIRWHHWFSGHHFEQTLEIMKDREAWCAAVHRVAKSQSRFNDWTTAMKPVLPFLRIPMADPFREEKPSKNSR